MIANLRYVVGNFGGRTTGVGGSSKPSQPQIQPTYQYRQDQDNGERQHSVSDTGRFTEAQNRKFFTL